MGTSYEHVRSLHVGATTEVFEAIASGLGDRRVALKRLRSECRRDPQAVVALVREAEVATLVQHANVAQVLDAGEDASGPYICFELVDGLTLEEVCADGPLEVSLGLHLGIEVLQALAAVHGALDAEGGPAGLVHRDVKPSNVLVSWAGDLRLIDFSIAGRASAQRQTRVGRTHGTEGYMSPEQAAGAPVDPRTDLYAVGCLMARMLGGASPLQHEAARDACYAGEPVPLDSAIPSDVRAVLQRALAFSPARRFASASEMIEALWPLMAKSAAAEPRAALRRLLEPRRAGPRTAKATPLQALFDTGVLPGGSRTRPDRPPAVVAVDLDSDAEATQRAPVPVQGTLLGTEIHGYRLLEHIGAGGSSLVFRARHEALGIDYAVKVLRPEMSTSIGLRRMEREAWALRHVDHPNVSRLVDFGQLDDGRAFLTTEFQDGDSLRARLSTHGPLTEQEVGDLLLQVALGLAVAHEAGVVHRDLKLGNLMLGGPAGDLVKIIDFGIARLTNDEFEGTQLTRANALLGTRTHMAPEQIESAKDVTPAVDVYALGVCAHQLLRGVPPFLGPRDQILDQHRHAPPPRLEGVNRAFADLIDAALAKDPAARPDAAEFARTLRALGFVVDRGQTRNVQREDPTHLVPPLGATALVDAPKPAPRSQSSLRLALAGLTIALVAGLGTAALILGRGATPRPAPVGAPSARPPQVAARPSAAPKSEVVAVPEVSPDPEPGPVRPRRRRRAAAAAAAAAKALDASAARARVRHTLAAAGVGQDWLRAAPNLSASRRRYEAALAGRSQTELDAATEALVRAVEAEVSTGAFVRRRLAKAADMLEAAVGQIDPKVAMTLEARYFELRAAAQSESQPSLRREIGKLIRDIAVATKR